MLAQFRRSRLSIPLTWRMPEAKSFSVCRFRWRMNWFPSPCLQSKATCTSKCWMGELYSLSFMFLKCQIYWADEVIACNADTNCPRRVSGKSWWLPWSPMFHVRSNASWRSWMTMPASQGNAFSQVPAEMGGPCLKWRNFTLAMAIEVYFHGANDDNMIKHPSVIAMLLGKMINHGIWRIPVSRQTHACSVTCALNESMGPISCNFPTILRAGFELTYSNKQMYRDLAHLGRSWNRSWYDWDVTAVDPGVHGLDFREAWRCTSGPIHQVIPT